MISIAFILIATARFAAEFETGVLPSSTLMLRVLPFVLVVGCSLGESALLTFAFVLWSGAEWTSAQNLARSLPVVDDGWLLIAVAVALGAIALGIKRFLLAATSGLVIAAAATWTSMTLGHGSPLLIGALAVLVLLLVWLAGAIKALVSLTSGRGSHGSDGDSRQPEPEEDNGDDPDAEKDGAEDVEPRRDETDFDPVPAEGALASLAMIEALIRQRRAPFHALLLFLAVLTVLLMDRPDPAPAGAHEDLRGWMLAGWAWAAGVWALASLRIPSRQPRTRQIDHEHNRR